MGGLAVSLLFAGRFLERAERYTFCAIVTGLVCVLMPLGTILGVVIMTVLNRPKVRNRFSEKGQIPVNPVLFGVLGFGGGLLVFGIAIMLALALPALKAVPLDS